MYRPHHRSRRLTGTLGLLGLALLASTPAVADTCNYVAGEPTANRTPAALTGSVTVGRDQAVGSTVATLWNNIEAYNMRIDCDAPTVSFTNKIVSAPYPRLDISVPGVPDGALFATPVAGIGVWVRTVVEYTEAGRSRNFSTPLQPLRWVDAFLVKYADEVGTGVIRGSDLPRVQRSAGDNRLLIIDMGFTGQVNIIGSTCRTPDVLVKLGDHKTTSLSGKGAGTDWVPVPIVLTDCPAFHGSSRIDWYAGSDYTATVNPNTIGFTINPTTGSSDLANGLIELAPGGATGVAVQLVDANTRPVPMQAKHDSGLTLTTASNGTYTIPLQARYIQTGDVVTGGAANASATVTFTYL